MQIAVVEIPNVQGGEHQGGERPGAERLEEEREQPGRGAESSTQEGLHWRPGLAKASGVWSRAQLTDEARGPRSSGVFPAVGAVGGQESANDVWRWVPPSANEPPEGGLRLVVFQRGATWPPFLAREISGGATTCVVAEVLGDGLSGLVQRVARRAAYMNLPVAQLVWISGETRRSAPHRWVKQLSDVIRAETTVLVVRAQQPSVRRRASRRSGSPSRASDSEIDPWLSRPTGSD